MDVCKMNTQMSVAVTILLTDHVTSGYVAQKCYWMCVTAA